MPEDLPDVIELEANSARGIVRLLELLAEVPSTPAPVAEEAFERAGTLSERLPEQPRQPEAGGRPLQGVVILERPTATAIAGLLDLLGGLPSTSPAMASEATEHGELLWGQLTDSGR